MTNEIHALALLLKQTFEKGAWHGPSVKEALAGISAEQASSRLPDSHSIIELVGHMTSWREFVFRKMQGDADYTVTEQMNFPALTNWAEAVQNLEASQEQLLTALEKFPEEKLSQQAPTKTTPLTFHTLLHGIIHHDLYHTGQIMLIKKSFAKQSF